MTPDPARTAPTPSDAPTPPAAAPASAARPPFTAEHLRSLMPAGEHYLAVADSLQPYRSRCAELLDRINGTGIEDHEQREPLMRELFGRLGPDSWIMPRFLCEFGLNIEIGPRALINFDAIMFDSAPITIGADALFGPRCQLYTADHPFDPAARRGMWEIARPITIGDSVWFGGGVVVLPGVTIGDRAIVAAASVVTRDVPPDTLVAGSPARALRSVREEDRVPERG